MSGLRVLSPGLFTTVQDQGRPGYRQFGVPVGGAFDRRSLAIANALADNPASAACLETTVLGPRLEALQPVYVAIAGARHEVVVETQFGRDRQMLTPCAFPLLPGDRLRMLPIRRGCRAYLAVHGGLFGPPLLGSASREEPLEAGSLLACPAATGPFNQLDPSLCDAWLPDPDSPLTLRALAGPDLTDPGAWPADTTFEISHQLNRVGLALDDRDRDPNAQRPDPPDPNRLSAPVAPGALQWTGTRWLLIGVAGGTTGGYPHLAQVISTDLSRLAQCTAGQLVRFARISLHQARQWNEESESSQSNLTLRIRTRVRDAVHAVSETASRPASPEKT